MTYGDKYDYHLTQANGHIYNATVRSSNGDLWEAKIELSLTREHIIESEKLLMEVSKIAFGRVFDSKVPHNA